MNKSESKYYNTACLMDQALLLLLDKKDFDYITIKEICEKAGVNRSTFYLHYETMEDLLAESIVYLKKQLFDKYKPEDKVNPHTDKLDSLMMITPSYVVPYLEFIRENKKVFMVAVSEPNLFEVEKTFNKMDNELFKPIMERYNVPDNERMYRLKFYMSGIHAIITEWIKNGCKDDISFISNLIINLIGVENEING